MAGTIDITGQRFGRLTVLARAANRSSDTSAWWRCRCSCGAETECKGVNLRRGQVRSCGCLRTEQNVKYFRNKYRMTDQTVNCYAIDADWDS